MQSPAQPHPAASRPDPGFNFPNEAALSWVRNPCQEPSAGQLELQGWELLALGWNWLINGILVPPGQGVTGLTGGMEPGPAARWDFLPAPRNSLPGLALH